jgi:hypothetical protein
MKRQVADCGVCGLEGPDRFGNYGLLPHDDCPYHGTFKTVGRPTGEEADGPRRVVEATPGGVVCWGRHQDRCVPPGSSLAYGILLLGLYALIGLLVVVL